jgi:UPF0755 protein
MSQLEPFMTTSPLPPSRHRRTWGKALAALVSIGLLVGMVVAAFVLLRGSNDTTDYAGAGTGSAVVVVSRGDTLTEIARKLQAAGVVLTADAFVNAAGLDERAQGIGPGKYTLREQMNSAAALELMLDPTSRADSRLVLPEGLRLEQTVNTAAKATSLPKSDFQKVLQDPAQLNLPTWAKNRPEGFMFPASYDLTGDETARTLLRSLVKRFNQASADVGLEARAKEVGLSPYQVLIVASLLQAEAAPNDFGKVARVIYNRLAADMPLQLDSTVSYALGVNDLALSEDQLRTASPYNTYLRRGLPPRPINSPGEAAIEAALDPPKGKWLYFVLLDPNTRETKFATSYDKFLQLKKQYQQNLSSFEQQQASASASPSSSPTPGG